MIKYKFENGLKAFGALHVEFPIFGWESMAQEEFDQLADTFYEEEKSIWEYFVKHGQDGIYDSRVDVLNERLDGVRKQRSIAAYDNSLADAQQWMKDHPKAQRGYAVKIGRNHGNDIIEQFKTEGHPNAVLYVCEE